MGTEGGRPLGDRRGAEVWEPRLSPARRPVTESEVVAGETPEPAEDDDEDTPPPGV